jgi:hypothetical protein
MPPPTEVDSIAASAIRGASGISEAIRTEHFRACVIAFFTESRI